MSFTGDEARIRRLEEEVQALRRALANVKDKLGQVAEDNARQLQDDAAGGGLLIRLQSVGVIPASSGSGLGMGTARFLKTVGTTRYLTQPFADGDVTSECANDTGSPTVNNEYLIGAYVQGVLTAIVGDCATATPGRAPDPPA